MQRVTISLDDALLAVIDERVTTHGYQGRSEAIRDLLRAGLLEPEAANPDDTCVATLSYVYDHGTRELSKRLNSAFHEHHDLTLSTLHVHLDQGKCMEVSVLKGSIKHVTALTRQVMAERGVRHGAAQIIPLPTDEGGHSH
ncbi:MULTISPECIES: nickel-responsive transcriptional regulator NikR [Pseudomonas]|jgi:CopG family nickel-responsive transcriptional regulator|uniref:nickel-responsive transcriptional regulator NikR n=1 Tax=Pseudomonas TaxID=286 RepID=UPI00064214A9|nr:MULTISPECIES: nickel-responsive transcriptional regulator NikR [Pseudomonas]KMM82824.1 nickel responsive regulator [Pseudomonas lundensis]MBM1181307.1 nickel-responsive transcriptional regulator NikR [Pseudomonas lundensis]MBS5838164.1 nickel-responsive transcriptional regulator NikR [Pseudomonas sp.]NMZ99680.1 nickel-responsive transcriptional regulator NikR [Pseudomonas lundensis]NNA11968.1 nickel-responsive transcriptional regulator NikR [Pseudomonas lundensis]